MRESEQFRAAEEWLQKTRMQGHSARDACMLLLEGPTHVAVLIRLVRLLGVHVSGPPSKPPPARATRERLRSVITDAVDNAISNLGEPGELETMLAELSKRTRG